MLLTDASGPEQPDVDRLLDQVSRLSERQVHMCGPQPLLTVISRALRRRGVSAAAVPFESFRFR